MTAGTISIQTARWGRFAVGIAAATAVTLFAITVTPPALAPALERPAIVLDARDDYGTRHGDAAPALGPDDDFGTRHSSAGESQVQGLSDRGY